MIDLASPAEGARTLGATSFDDNHGPECIIDGNEKTFWMTTGLYPQEVIIELAQPSHLDQIKISCSNLQRIHFLGSSENSSPSAWESIGDCELPDTDGRVQVETCSIAKGAGNGINGEIKFIKIQIVQGWDDFGSIHSLEILSRE